MGDENLSLCVCKNVHRIGIIVQNRQIFIEKTCFQRITAGSVSDLIFPGCRQLCQHHCNENDDASQHFLKGHAFMQYQPSEENSENRFHAHDNRSYGRIRSPLPKNLKSICDTAGKNSGVKYGESGFPDGCK